MGGKIDLNVDVVDFSSVNVSWSLEDTIRSIKNKNAIFKDQGKGNFAATFWLNNTPIYMSYCRIIVLG